MRRLPRFGFLPRPLWNAALLLATAVALLARPVPARALDCSDPSFISQSSARAIVMSQFIATSPYQSQLIAYAYPVPVVSGDVIAPAELEDGGPSMTASGCAWLFYLDLDPEEDFFHPTQFVLVGGSSSAPEISSVNEEWWPTLDGVELYGVAEDNKTTADRFFGSIPPEDATCGVMPPLAPRAVGPSTAAAAKQWAIGFIGPDTYLNNWTQFKAALGTYAAVPDANCVRWIFHDDNMKAAVKEANDNGAQRVFVFIACHGLEGSHKLQTRDDPDLAPADVAPILAGLDACSVYVVINACHSGNFRQPIVDALKARSRKLNANDPSTIAVFTSSSDAGSSTTDGNNEIGYFVKALIKGWGQSGVTTLEQAYDWTVSGGNTCTKSRNGSPQKLVSSMGCDPTPTVHSTWGLLKVRYR